MPTDIVQGSGSDDKDWFSPEEMFNDPNTAPDTGWFKFEKPGDAIAGPLVMEPYDQDGNFGMQKVYVINTKDGDVNVSLKATSNKRQIRQLAGAEVGDVLAFRFADWYDSGKGNPGKSIEVRIRKMNK